MPEQSENPMYRVVCERCEMQTGWMTKQMAEKGRAAHQDATGHDTEVEHDA